MYKVREYNPVSESSAMVAEYETLEEAKQAANKIPDHNGEVWDEADELCIYAARVSAAASAMGKKGGASRTPAKKSASAANLDAARKAGKVGGWKKGVPRKKKTEGEN